MSDEEDRLYGVIDSPDSRQAGLFQKLGQAVAQVARSAASAGELFVDKDLRKKASTLVVSEASRRLRDLQEGVSTRAGNIQRGIEDGPRQVQSLYSRIQKQYLASRHEASLKARRDMPVDVQVGPFVWEDAPQELRSRLWIALLTHPHLIGNLVQEKVLEDALLHTDEGNSAARSSHSGGTTPTHPAIATHADSAAPDPETSHDSSVHTQRQASSLKNEGSPNGRLAGLPPGLEEDGGSELGTTLHSPACCEGLPASETELSRSGRDASTSTGDHQGATEESQQVSAIEADAGKTEGSSAEGSSNGGSGGEDPWEIVQAGSSLNDWRGSQLGPAQAQLQPGSRGEAMTLREQLLEAIWEVAWPISTVYREGSRYDTLSQISIGQEEVEEVITRDINRTFPEHPQFSFEQGQQELFRVLKAYSLHDLQVGYCQGMAFVTGVILMYIPEEPAFRLLTRLMDERGANLRQLYLPGLEGLKSYLRMFEWLLERIHPELKQHLEDYGVVPVLYASQWFLTAFSCPFPTPFACRVIDVMLTENCGHVMLRVGMAVIDQCRDALLELQDFEDIVTYLKVEPVKWSLQRTRAVLNEAVQGSISEDMLLSAAQAVSQGYDGSLSRRPSSIRPEAAAVVAATLDSNRLSGKGLSSVPSRIPEAVSLAASGEFAPDGGDAEAEMLAQQQAEMDAEYRDIVLALDALWVGGEAAPDGSPTSASE